MARPKKEKELLHHHQIMLRLTDTEYEIVFEKAKDANLPLAEYARKQVLNKKIVAKYEIVADLPELKTNCRVWKNRQQPESDCPILQQRRYPFTGDAKCYKSKYRKNL